MSGLERKTPLRRVGKVGRRRAAGMRAAKAAVLERSGGRCEAMFAPDCRHVGECLHHIVRRSQGGDESLANLIHSCHACHTGRDGIHNRPEEARRRGLLRLSGEASAMRRVQDIEEGENL